MGLIQTILQRRFSLTRLPHIGFLIEILKSYLGASVSDHSAVFTLVFIDKSPHRPILTSKMEELIKNAWTCTCIMENGKKTLSTGLHTHKVPYAFGHLKDSSTYIALQSRQIFGFVDQCIGS